MGAEEKNRNEILSRIAADLFVQSKGGGEALSSKIQRLRDELKKVIESEDTLFGKFLGLAESFREIIPDEKQRYNAAVKAVTTTSKVSRQDIVKAVNNQLEELKILEKALFSAPSGLREDLTVMEARSREIREEISKLQEKIGQLESEEKEIANGMATREKDRELVSKAVGELFKEITTEITYINKKVAEVTAESTASRPVLPRDSVKIDVPSQEKGGEQKSEILEPSVPRDTELQKRCPMCGERMDLNTRERKWRCSSCAYEELKKAETGVGEQKKEIPAPSAPQDAEWQKKCPMCGGRMDFYINEKKWICFSCAYEEPKEAAVQDKNEMKIELEDEPKPAPASEPISKPSPSFAVPLADISFDEYQEPKKRPSSSHHQPSIKKKTCPACHKRMSWHEEDKAWRCSFCGYERSI